MVGGVARAPGNAGRKRSLLAGLALLTAIPSTASVAGALPNLAAYRPNGWSGPLVVSRGTGSHSDSSSLSPSDRLYVDWAVLNDGTGSTTKRFYVELDVDGEPRARWYVDPPLERGFYVFIEDFALGKLSPGQHTLTLRIDSTGVIDEESEADNRFSRTITVGAAGACATSGSALCLDKRFRVTSSWRLPSGQSGAGAAIALTSRSGYFRFFGGKGAEVAVKMVDGRGINNRFWFYYGGLTDVEYTLTVTDTRTGTSKSYANPAGKIASFADVATFVGDTATTGPPDLAAAPLGGDLPVSGPRPTTARIALTAPATRGTCRATKETLCLNKDRFRIRVEWIQPTGVKRSARTVQVSSDVGYFWFFDASTIDLMIKTVDGTRVNGRYWIYFGGLSDVQYTITVEDTLRNEQQRYMNPAGQLLAVGHTQAFPVPARQPLVFDPPAPPDATVGVPYSFSFCDPPPAGLTDLCRALPRNNPTGGVQPYFFKTKGGFPPFGLYLNLNGILAGVPSAPGQRTFDVCVTDLCGLHTVCRSVTIMVREDGPPPPPPGGGINGTYRGTLLANVPHPCPSPQHHSWEAMLREENGRLRGQFKDSYFESWIALDVPLQGRTARFGVTDGVDRFDFVVTFHADGTVSGTFTGHVDACGAVNGTMQGRRTGP